MKIKGYEDYEIYEDGRIISYKNGKTREMKCGINSEGYKGLQLWKDGKVKHFKIHRLLALHFIENTRIGIANEVDHIDRNKLNNSLENLRWATRQEQNDNRGGIYEMRISKGCLYKNNKIYYCYQWHEDKIKMCKSFKNLELAQAFQIEHLKRYNLQLDS